MKPGIAFKLSLLLAAFVVVTAGLTGYQTYLSSRELLVRSAHERLLTTTRVVARRINGMLDEAQRDLLMLADSGEAHELLRRPGSAFAREHVGDLGSRFSALMRFKPQYFQIRLISASDNGLERVRVDRVDANQLIVVSGDDLQEKGHLPYVRQPLGLKAGEVYMSRVVINRETGAHAGMDVPTIRVATPLFDEHNRALGVAVLSMSLSQMFKRLGDDLPASHSLYVTNYLGDYLVHPDPGKAFAFEQGRRSRVQDEFPQTAALFGESPIESLLIDEINVPGVQDAALATFVRQALNVSNGRGGFVLGLAQSRPQVLAATDALGQRTIGIVAMFSFFALIAAVLMARAVTLPLRQLSAAAQRFAQQRIVEPLGWKRDDEVGQLATSLNAMQEDVVAAIAEIKRSHEKLEYQASHDALTGLPNRHLLIDRIGHAAARSRRTGLPVALFFIDLDNFKTINDAHGHVAGDAVLCEVAERMRASVRESDTVARLGGDEFVVLLDGVEQEELIGRVAQKLIDQVRLPIRFGDAVLSVGASVGISRFVGDGTSAVHFIDSADGAMYRAKQAGGSNYEFCS